MNEYKNFGRAFSFFNPNLVTRWSKIYNQKFYLNDINFKKLAKNKNYFDLSKFKNIIKT